MSRGPGRWQRLILECAKSTERFNLAEVLPDSYSRSDYTAAARAAIRLAELGRIELWKGIYGRRRLIVQRLKVESGANLPATQHLPVTERNAS